MLSPAAQSELDRALALDLHAQQTADIDIDEQVEPSSSSSKRVPAKTSAASSLAPEPEAEDDAEAAESRPAAKAKYSAQLGIEDLLPVQRRGVRCAHCRAAVAKGTLRFSVCYKLDKPPRSIHTDCLFQLPAECIKGSISFLQKRLAMPLSDAEHEVCTGALETLSTLQPS